MDDLYLSLKASISNWIFTMSDTLPDETKLFDFDSTAEEEELEQVDMMGPLEFYVSVEETLGTVGFKVAVATYEDPQIQRLNAAINKIVNTCQGKNLIIPILHYDTGNPLGHLSSNGGLMVSPVVRLQSKTRPLQTVSLVFNLTLSF